MMWTVPENMVKYLVEEYANCREEWKNDVLTKERKGENGREKWQGRRDRMTRSQQGISWWKSEILHRLYRPSISSVCFDLHSKSNSTSTKQVLIIHPVTVVQRQMKIKRKHFDCLSFLLGKEFKMSFLAITDWFRARTVQLKEKSVGVVCNPLAYESKLT